MNPTRRRRVAAGAVLAEARRNPDAALAEARRNPDAALARPTGGEACRRRCKGSECWRPRSRFPIWSNASSSWCADIASGPGGRPGVSVGGDHAAAEDVTQDAFVAAYRGLPRFRGEASLETWFYRILIRQAHSHRRWRRVREALSGPIRSDEAPDPNPAGAGDPALRRRIGAALEALSSHQRDAFVLVHLEGFTVSETAAILGKAEGTIKSHLHRALSGLRRGLGDLRGGAGERRE